ncbi:plasmid replication, integration and excision activator [Mobilicoccus caccae]|uniref:Plasmid replication, integration and excision activator n=1 Tax=Mobilicoccus caccae TaxID=1859295 RepID=A0ABQ6ITZ2_9MICO|nr:plasmid replication, integration and excision activator [Mobilicoccus caccae]GMA40845.1 hypothetical protein GCM10025883_28900 [Mobilicoccus caccae]
MAIQKRFPVQHADVFPAGAWLVGAVEPVSDFNAPARPDGSRPQQLDKDTGLPLWSVPVLDADEQAGKRDKTITVKIAATHQPVPPSNDTPFPFTAIEFVGLTALPWVDDSGSRPRIAWSFKADALAAPGAGRKTPPTAEKAA